MTELLTVDDDQALPRAVTELQRGGVVVIPTDTVYGIAGLPGVPGTVAAIMRAKGRPEAVNLPLVGWSSEQLETDLGIDLGPHGRSLAARFWPGSLTLAVGFSSDRPRPPWLEHRVEVGVRVPDHRFIADLTRAVGTICLTSANVHGQPTPPGAEAAAAGLLTRPGLAVDAGPLRGAPSTLVNVNLAAPVIERLGDLPADLISEALGFEVPIER